MPKARRLKSGNWRAQAFDHVEMVDGKKKYVHRSFTARTKWEAERLANAFLAKKGEQSCEMRFEDAIDKYCEIKSHTLSPSTINGYKIVKRTAYGSLLGKRIDQITKEDVQNCINEYAIGHSAKSCKNALGLLTAVITTFIPNADVTATIPIKSKVDYYTPTDEDIERLLKAITSRELRKAVLLAAFGTMRRSEICGLMDTDIDGDAITIRRTMVRSPEGGYVVKDTAKNETSQRTIIYPHFVIKEFEGVEGYLVKMKPDKITGRFISAVKKAGLPHFRFHDLRAYSVSIAHAIGIPDVYIMERGGWKTDATFKAIYRRTMSDKSREFANVLNDHYEKLHTKLHTKPDSKKRGTPKSQI